jgi:hypothetical protein
MAGISLGSSRIPIKGGGEEEEISSPLTDQRNRSKFNSHCPCRRSEKGFFVCLSPGLRGKLFILRSSSDIHILSSFNKRFSIGQAICCKVLACNKNECHLRFTLIGLEPEGQVQERVRVSNTEVNSLQQPGKSEAKEAGLGSEADAEEKKKEKKKKKKKKKKMQQQQQQQQQQQWRNRRYGPSGNPSVHQSRPNLHSPQPLTQPQVWTKSKEVRFQTKLVTITVLPKLYPISWK